MGGELYCYFYAMIRYLIVCLSCLVDLCEISLWFWDDWRM
jgi:hypothetical protein